MEELLAWIEFIEENADSRQQSKVLHRLKDIIVIVLFAMLPNADDWVEIGIFATYHEEYLSVGFHAAVLLSPRKCDIIYMSAKQHQYR